MEHQLTVPVPVEVAWPALIDPQRVAPCMPGATLTRAEGNEFEGSVKVKIGPVSLLYKGSGSFTDIDADSRRVIIDASGKDARGNGTAAATVTAVLSPADTGTSVQVTTDLKVTGRPAQLGRGMISEVAGKILNQFAECLAQQLSTGEAVGGKEKAAEASATGGPAAGEKSPQAAEKPTWSESAESMARHPSGSTQRASWSVTAPKNGEGAKAPEPDVVEAPVAGESVAGEPAAEPSAEPVPGVSEVPEPMDSQEAIDLLGAAGVPVLKRLAPIIAAVVVGAVVFSILRRRRRRLRQP